MTKVLHIPSGAYVTFLSSVKYDRNHIEDYSERVINYEDSTMWEDDKQSLEEFMNEKFKYGGMYLSSYSWEELIECDMSEFEIIYD